MAQEIINVGTTPNDGTGDTLRIAIEKVNFNFTDLYTNSYAGNVVTAFNTRVGAVTLNSSDVTTALTYVPLNSAGDTATGVITFNSGWISNGSSTLNLNSALISGLPVTVANSSLRIVGADNTAGIISIDSFSATSPNSRVIFRAARGIGATPTAIQNNDVMGSMTAHGYGASAFGSSSTGAIQFMSEGNFTDASQPTAIVFQVTPVSSITKAEQVRITSNGVLQVESTIPATNQTTGALVVGGGVGIAGAAYASTATAGTNNNQLASTAFVTTAVASGGIFSNVVTKSANYNILQADIGTFFKVSTATLPITLTLPLISSLTAPYNNGFKVEAEKLDPSANALTVATSGGDTVNGSSSFLINVQYSTVIFVADPATNQWTAVTSSSSASNVNVNTFLSGVGFTAGTTTTITLTFSPGVPGNVDIFFDGAYQDISGYSISGTSVVFTSAIPAQVQVVECKYASPTTIVTPVTPFLDSFVNGVGFTAGTTTVLTSSAAPGTANNLQIYFDGTYQGTTSWNLVGSTITFNSAIPLGVQLVQLRYGFGAPINVPANGSVVDAIVATNAAIQVSKLQGNATAGLAVISTAASGNPIYGNPSGVLLNVRRITSTGAYTPTTGTNSVLVYLVGGGGAGAGAAITGASTISVGAGGGAGGVAISYLTTGFSGQTITIGAGGTGVAGTTGNTGGASSFLTMAANGGGGGGAAGPSSPPFTTAGTAGGSASGGNVSNTSGANGNPPMALSTSLGSNGVLGGAGGSNMFGTGGPNVSSATTSSGFTATGNGGGGGGAVNQINQAATATGGPGTAGVCIIYEYA